MHLLIATSTHIANATDPASGAAGVVGGVVLFVVLLLAWAFGLALYFLPSILGFARKKGNAVSILVLNLFLGWSLIGWVVSLVWALAQEPVPNQIIVHHAYSTIPTVGPAEGA